jgi:hypothetical protein
LPSLENLSQHFSDKPFLYIAIDVGEKDEVLKEFFKDEDLSYLNVLDTDETVTAQYGVRSHPVKFIINRDGNLIGTSSGYREWDAPEVKSLIELLINS